MGHRHLPRLPATRKWTQVLELLVEGAELETIAAAAAEAAESSLPRASRDPALVRAFWLLTQIPLAARTQDPAGNLKPAKDKSTERIDGIVALIMAIGRAMVVQEEPQPSYQMFVL